MAQLTTLLRTLPEQAAPRETLARLAAAHGRAAAAAATERALAEDAALAAVPAQRDARHSDDAAPRRTTARR